MSTTSKLDNIDAVQAFEPAPFLADRHLMTIVSSLWYRRLPGLLKQTEKRWFVEVGEASKVLVEMNVEESNDKSLILLVHGLEGCSQSHYMRGMACKALLKGFSVARMNLRNCGGTEHLTDTLYNAGMSDDVIQVAKRAVEEYQFKKVFLAGISLGGNVVLKAAAELAASDVNWLSGVCAISPSIDLKASVDLLEHGINRIYQYTFLRSLREKLLKKSLLYPDRFDPESLSRVKTVRQFDELYTAHDGGYESAEDYYQRASSINLLQKISSPGLIITAKDDPIVPFAPFENPELLPGNIQLICPDRGGHGGFLGVMSGGGASDIPTEPSESRRWKDRFWAEDRVVDFCLQNM